MVTTINPEKAPSIGKKLFKRARAIFAADGSISRLTKTLTPAELDALIKAIDEEMGPDQVRAHNERRPGLVLAGEAQRLWDRMVAESAPRADVIPLARNRHDAAR